MAVPICLLFTPDHWQCYVFDQRLQKLIYSYYLQHRPVPSSSRHSWDPSRNSKVQQYDRVALVIVIHLIVTTGLALIASGASSFGAQDGKNKNDEMLIKTGVMVLVVAWILIAASTLISFLPSQRNRHAPIFIDGSKLLYAVLFSLPFVFVRLMYSVISIFSPSRDLNPVSGSLGLKIGLSFLMELIVVIAFTFVGLATHGIRLRVERTKHTRMRSLGATQREAEAMK
ncbi:hypothetical protein BKA64DRAFT_700629 [Cadophora sp. MPI-SDFR-AT-0126]|nr:hypothetical protein BKA64DRAFT_700629 [Leotiomycetes sp. MPI-SDFR-AT-0126]